MQLILKYVQKLCALDFEIVAVSRPCIIVFWFRYRFELFTYVEPDFRGFLTRVHSCVESQGAEEIKFFCKRTDESQNLRIKAWLLLTIQQCKHS